MNRKLCALSLVALVALTVAGCAPAAASAPAATSGPSLSSARLVPSSGAERAVEEVLATTPWTVLVFVSAACPCLDAHKGRLAELAKVYGPRGVQFIAVDSEVGTTREGAAATSVALGLPVMLDPGAKLASALDADYATYSVLLDRRGRVVYRGGVDSDKRKLHDTATPYLRDALDDVLAGAPPRRAEGKALGCMLRKW
ncbi:MAG TPA: redoxin family protein [Polyangiaceae bacterium]|nr:redoxin family protein [Polyangiaceae bacterium]